MKTTFIIELKTKPRKFTEKDFNPEQDYEFEDDDYNLTKQVDESFHEAFAEWLDKQLENDEIESEVLMNSDRGDELPIKDFNDFGSVSIILKRCKGDVEIRNTKQEGKK